jgi:type II secretion system protein H
MRPGLSSSRHAGFTLVELMVVIVIIGIMTALMIPEMKGSFQDALLRSSSRELVNVFDLAYSRAVSLNQVRRVRFEEQTGRYEVEKQIQARGDDVFVPADDVPENKGQLDARISIEFHQPGEFSSAENGDNGASVSAPVSGPVESMIAFYPDGTADAGAMVLRDRQGYRLLLQINSITARVHVVEMEREVHP